jgi:phosphate:Na+ symporter
MNGVVTTSAAVFITLGQNIGSCVTALVSCIGTTRTAKRAACIHLLFNIAGAVIFGVAFVVVFAVSPTLASHNITAVEISIFHTLFNITCTLVMSPFAKLLVKLSGIIIPEKEAEGQVVVSDDMSEAEIEVSRHFDNRLMRQPSVALERATNEVVEMAKAAYDNIEYSSRAVVQNSHELVEKIYTTEQKVDYYAKYLTDYLVKLNNTSLTDKQHFVVNNLFHAVIDIERISDRAENLAELAEYKIQNDIVFSKEGNEELRDLFNKVLLCLSRCISARDKLDKNAVKDVYRIEDQVDDLEDNLRNTHIQRLSDGLCESAASVVFLDVLTNLERVSDHCKNIAEGVHDEISAN